MPRVNAEEKTVEEKSHFVAAVLLAFGMFAPAFGVQPGLIQITVNGLNPQAIQIYKDIGVTEGEHLATGQFHGSESEGGVGEAEALAHVATWRAVSPGLGATTASMSIC
jgi:hypothetical protein